MAHAYCLTCNEQVVETPSGTCPLGHPVAAHEAGPEPWVGFAGDTVTDQVDRYDADALSGPVGLPHRVDVDGRVHAHAGVNGHANGAVNGHATAFASPPPPPSSDLVSDDLSALLAEALGTTDAPMRDATPPTAAPAEPTAPTEPLAPVEPVAPVDHTEPAGAPDQDDWDDLAHLAAELQLGDDLDSDDGPTSVSPDVTPSEMASPHPASPDVTVDDLLAELHGSALGPDVPAAAPVDEAPRVETPVDAVPTPEAPSFEDPTPLGDAPPPAHDVPSPPAADPVDIWAAAEAAIEAEADEEPEPRVDLSNFTARGRRVGDAAPRPARRKRKWKR